MDKGMSHIRIGLFPAIVSGDYLASPSCSMLHLLIARACPMSDDTGLSEFVTSSCSPFMYVPLRAILLDHVYTHFHGSSYLMMDSVSHVYHGLLTLSWTLYFLAFNFLL